MGGQTSPAAQEALSPAAARFLSDALEGLSADPKRLPSKYFYDRWGSELFDRICELPEYYLTRTEVGLLRRHGRAIGRQIGPRALVIELGSGSTLKIRLLLRSLEHPAGYVPVDISGEYLEGQARELRRDFPSLSVLPVVADFMTDYPVPRPALPERSRVAFFPGSTIGNFTPAEAQGLLRRVAAMVAPRGGLLIGIDLRKERSVLEAAYNDRAGVTRAFNLNLLRRLRDELGAELRLEDFDHRATYNERLGRIEMHLVSRVAQTVTLNDRRFRLAAGESIHTENSYKFDLEDFGRRAREAGLRVAETWTDDRRWFALLYLRSDRMA